MISPSRELVIIIGGAGFEVRRAGVEIGDRVHVALFRPHRRRHGRLRSGLRGTLRLSFRTP